MNIFWLLWEAIVTAIVTAFVLYLFSKKLGSQNPYKSVIGAFVIFTVIFLLKAFLLSEPLIMCVSIVLYIGYACLAFRRNWSTRILWGCVPIFIALVASVLTFSIAKILDYGDFATEVVRFYLTATCTLLQIIMFLVIANIGKKATYQFTLFQLFFLVGMAILSIIAVNKQMTIIQTLSNITGTETVQRDTVFVSLCFLVFLIAAILLVYNLGKESQQKVEKSLEARQANLENEYYKSNEISINALRELRHDISTHMHVMKTLMDQEKTKELREYFDTLADRYKKDSTLFLTENTMLNAMLTSKMLAAQNDHIDMRLSYSTKREIPLPATDFCSLVGNMIDNAIEANGKIENLESRYIDMDVGDKGDMIYIKVKNCSDGIYNFLDGELQTTKNSTKNGIGLKRIRKIAESAGGFFDTNPRPDEFTAVVMLPSNSEE